MKKVFAFILVFVLAAGIFAVAGCTPEDDKGGTLPDYSGGDPAKKWYVSETPITVKVFFRDRPDYSVKNNDKSSALMTMKLIEEKCNVRFQWETAQWDMSQANTQFTASINGTTSACDLYVFTYAKLSAYGELGAFYDYGADLATYAKSLSGIIDSDEDYKRDLSSINDKMYILPEFTAIKNEKMYMIRKDWLDECNLAVPETLDEFYTVLKTFKQRYGADKANFYPFTFDNGLNGMNLYESFGVDMSISSNTDFFLEDGALKYGPTDSRTKEFVAYMHKLYSESLIDPDYESNSSKADSNFEQGLSGVTFGYGTKIDRYQQRLDALAAKNPNNPNIAGAKIIGFLPPKNGENGVRQTRRQLSKISDAGAAAIYVRSKYKKEILRIFDFVYSEEGQMLLNFGLEEGKDGGKYTPTYKLENGQPVYNDAVTRAVDANGIALAPADAVRKYGMAMDFPTKQDIRYENQVASEEVKSIRQEYLGIIAEPVPKLKFTGFETNSISTTLTSLTQKYLTWLNGFIQGKKTVSEANWNQFVGEMNGLGLGQVVEIYNDAYVRYLGEK